MAFRTTRYRGTIALFLGVCALLAGLAPVSAQEADEATKSAARFLAQEGDALLAQEDYASASDRFERAWKLFPAPTLQLRQAQCLVKLGRWVEASERYVAIGRLKLPAEAPEAYVRAKETAETEGDQLRRRLPQLQIRVSPQAAMATLTINGRPLPQALWGMKFPVDPGKIALLLQDGSRRVQMEVSLAEGETRVVALEFEAPASSSTAQTKPTAVPAILPPAPSADVRASGTEQRLAGWLSLGVGGAALLTGAIAGLAAASKQSSFDDKCVDRVCPDALSSDLEAYDRLRTISTAGFAIGAVGSLLGITLLVTAPPSKTPPSRAFLHTGPSSAVLTWTGAF